MTLRSKIRDFFKSPPRSHTVTVYLRSGDQIPMVAYGDTIWEAVLDVVSRISGDWLSLKIGYSIFFSLYRRDIEAHIASGTRPKFEDWNGNFIQ